MAELSIIKAKYKQAVEGLWPQGVAWRLITDASSLLYKLNCLIASEVQRLDQRSQVLIRETNPKTAFEMLDGYEEFLQIPDECTPSEAAQTLNDRRTRICQKLVTGGGQTPAFFKLIAQQLGYDSDQFTVSELTDYRVGRQRMGDRLTNGRNTPSTGWAYTYAVIAPAELVQKFSAGQSTVGERLVVISNETLQCLIEKFKPAHVDVIFSLGENI